MKNICYPMGGVEYSTDEKVVGKWMDQDLYQRTVQVNITATTALGTIVNTEINLSQFGINLLVNIWGTIEDGTVIKPINYINLSHSDNGVNRGIILHYVKASHILTVFNDTVVSPETAIMRFTIQYTKN